MMRALFAALFLLCSLTAAAAQTGTTKTQTQLNTEVGTTGCTQPTCLFPDNSLQQITPFDLRQAFLDSIATFYGMNGDCTVTGTYAITCMNTNGVPFGPLATLQTLPADTYLGAVASGVPMQLSINACSGALTYTLGSGFGCNTGTGTGTVTNVAASPGGGLATSPGGGISTTGLLALSPARQTLPTTSIVTPTSHSGGFSANGSGTYTPPANVLWLEIKMVGAGGGGGAAASVNGSNGGDTCWNTTGSACTTPVLDAGGGSGGAAEGQAGSGGVISGSSTANVFGIAGNPGFDFFLISTAPQAEGGSGGTSCLGGGAKSFAPGNPGGNAPANSGSGGAGGTASALSVGSGGGAGACIQHIITSPAATYTYTAGAKGAGGAAGGQAGGNGGDGQIIIIEHYGS